MLLDNMQDLNIDSTFGDFTIQGDIQTISDTEVLTNLIQERVKTNFGEFRLNIEHGADIDRFIGVAISKDLIEDIKVSIISSLTYDGFIPTQDIDVIPLQIGLNRVYIRVIVKNPYNGKEIVVGTLYNNEVINND